MNNGFFKGILCKKKTKKKEAKKIEATKKFLLKIRTTQEISIRKTKKIYYLCQKT